MGDVGDDFRALREHRKEKKQSNYDYAIQLLNQLGVNYTSHNAGLHLILNTDKGKVHFYPTTGLWIIYNKVSKPIKRRGLKNMLKYLSINYEIQSS